MPVYRKGAARWRVVVHRGGLRRDWVIEGSKADAEAFEARMRVELATAANVEIALRVVPTFSDFCVSPSSPYRAHAETHLKASTWRNRVYQLATLDEHLGDLQLGDIGTAQIDAYKAARQRQGIRASTINDELKVLTAILNFARELGYQLPVPRVKPLKVRGKRRNAAAWSAEDVERLMRACAEGGSYREKDGELVQVEPQPDLLPLVVFLANTGCRKGEAIALETANVDLVHRYVKIWPSEDWQPKDEEPREVPINDALAPWLERAAKGSRWAFPCPRTGERYAFWPQRAFDRARAAAGLAGGPHTLRHTYATHFLATTPDLYLLAQVLGHSHQRVTELYAHLLPDHLARARVAVAFASPVTPAGLEAARRWGVTGS